MHHHVIPLKVYLTIFGSLLFLTIATVAVSYMPTIPIIHLIGALTIAAIKTSLIVMFFMHVRYNNHLIWAFASVGFFFVLLFMVFMMGDYISQYYSLTPSTYGVPFDKF
jgi:cytochrome c oxidase subunit 4